MNWLNIGLGVLAVRALTRRRQGSKYIHITDPVKSKEDAGGVIHEEAGGFQPMQGVAYSVMNPLKVDYKYGQMWRNVMLSR